MLVTTVRIGVFGKKATFVSLGSVTASRKVSKPTPSAEPRIGAFKANDMEHEAGSPTQLPWPSWVTVRGSQMPNTGAPFSLLAAWIFTVATHRSPGDDEKRKGVST